jgi:hypothetical protein
MLSPYTLSLPLICRLSTAASMQPQQISLYAGSAHQLLCSNSTSASMQARHVSFYAATAHQLLCRSIHIPPSHQLLCTLGSRVGMHHSKQPVMHSCSAHNYKTMTTKAREAVHPYIFCGRQATVQYLTHQASLQYLCPPGHCAVPMPTKPLCST